MENYFINLIKLNKLQTIDGLKKLFRKLAKQTHPDLVGNDLYVEKFIRIKEQYEEAKQYLLNRQQLQSINRNVEQPNFRFLFYKELFHFEMLQNQFLINSKDLIDRIKQSKEQLINHFSNWKPEFIILFDEALKEYDEIKNEKPKNTIENLRKPPFFHVLKPFFYNITKFHLTGQIFYQNQLKRSVRNIYLQLDKLKMDHLKKILTLLLNDMKSGAALFD